MNTNQPTAGKSNTPNKMPVLSLNDRMPKRWKIAEERSKNSGQQRVNHAIEYKHNEVLRLVKQLLSRSLQTVFERDYRHDNSQDFLSMHAFISPSFYLYLECELCFDYKVEYAFNNCPYKAQVRELLSHYPLNERSHEVRLKPDFNMFYRNVISIQDKQYITIL